MISGRRHRHTTMTSIELDDRTAFEKLATRHRRELQLHCYRMLGSLEESEDLVQETFLRAWRRRETFQGRSTPRAWLYRIATNACLDALQRSPRRPRGGEVPWLQPYPDELLEEIAEPEAEPDAQVVAKETIELAFMVAIQHLPPKTRAVLILRDVLDWPAKDTAALLETSVAAVNSALQRARAGLKEHLPERRAEWAPGADPTEAERELLDRYVEASDRADAHAIAALMREDSTWSMPPEPGFWRGRDAIVSAWVESGLGTVEFGEFRCRVTRANLQPAVACYLKRPGESEYRALALDVLRIEEGEIADITSFTHPVFPAFGLPPKL
jgi:RNA polymerase sigma-70 factor (ECF subfamily)